MGTAIALFFFLGGFWLIFEMIFSFLPKAQSKRLRIALVIGVFPTSLFVAGYTSLMTLGVLRSEIIDPALVQPIDWMAIALVFVFPVISKYVAIRKYQAIQHRQDSNNAKSNNTYPTIR